MGGFLVDTPSDFGLQGNSPSHPELLDWLAVDFIEHGWSVKHLVRQIVASRTYQQSSLERSEMAERDPTNTWYHRAHAKQLALTQFLNARHVSQHPGDERLESRLHSLELAFRMQSSATDAFDLSRETAMTRAAYGETPVGNRLTLGALRVFAAIFFKPAAVQIVSLG